MAHEHDTHTHRNLEIAETPLDAANQSLADALRASFGVLKGIMVVLVVLYLISNVRSIDAHEEALTLRLGRLHDVVDRPGLVWAFPFPIDEIIPLPTKKSNDTLIASHTRVAGVPATSFPRPGGGYRLRFGPPIEPEGKGPEAVEALTRRYLGSLEQEIREEPHLWMWMHDRWRV